MPCGIGSRQMMLKSTLEELTTTPRLRPLLRLLAYTIAPVLAFTARCEKQARSDEPGDDDCSIGGHQPIARQTLSLVSAAVTAGQGHARALQQQPPRTSWPGQ
eukprot:124433-Prymnesium_polylepis.1